MTSSTLSSLSIVNLSRAFAETSLYNSKLISDAIQSSVPKIGLSSLSSDGCSICFLQSAHSINPNVMREPFGDHLIASRLDTCPFALNLALCCKRNERNDHSSVSNKERCPVPQPNKYYSSLQKSSRSTQNREISHLLLLVFLSTTFTDARRTFVLAFNPDAIMIAIQCLVARILSLLDAFFVITN